MKFRAHETFFIRKGWLYKGLKNVQKNPSVFVSKDDNPMDVLGMGSNMVKSLRYWMQATQLASEPSVRGRSRAQSLTSYASIILNNDPYMEELGTLWMLHYLLVTNESLATSWYFFFNNFNMSEFSRNDFVVALSNYASMKLETSDTQPAEKSLEDDFNCIIGTYVKRKRLNPSKVQPESNIESPFDELGLVDVSNAKEKTFRKTTPKKGTINSYILLGVIVDQAKGQKEIRIQDLLNAPCNIGKVFNLDIVTLTAELERLSRNGLVEVIRTAGLDVVRLNSQLDFEQCMNEYYASLNA